MVITKYDHAKGPIGETSLVWSLPAGYLCPSPGGALLFVPVSNYSRFPRHAKGPIGGLRIFEAGHPVPDENSFSATQAAIELVKDLSAKDTVLFLLSGGGSALFERPLIPRLPPGDKRHRVVHVPVVPRHRRQEVARLPGLAGEAVGQDHRLVPQLLGAGGGGGARTTRDRLAAQGVKIFEVLQQNDAYHALQKVDGLVITGGTGTNVNDMNKL